MSVLLLKNAEIYTPAPLGKGDILVVQDKIAALRPVIDAVACQTCLGDVRIVDATDLQATPGLMDAHVHITGGGGEAGFASQVPPVALSTLIRAGITTVVGLLGTDGVTRHVDAVLAKACALEEEGLTAFIMSGGYPVPSPTLTGSIRSDMAYIDKVRGGKIAIADHRVAPVAVETLLDIATQVRVGGMLRGFVGMLIMHIGASPQGFDKVFEALGQAPYLGRHLIATHINRSPQAFQQAMELARAGGYMDISSGLNAVTLGPDTLKPSRALRQALESGINAEHILMSSDGNGSAARYGADGSVTGLVAASPATLLQEMADAVHEGLALSDALAPASTNVAKAYSLYPRKGTLQAGSDADILLLRPDMTIHSVFAKGQPMLEDGRLLRRGAFEE